MKKIVGGLVSFVVILMVGCGSPQPVSTWTPTETPDLLALARETVEAELAAEATATAVFQQAVAEAVEEQSTPLIVEVPITVTERVTVTEVITQVVTATSPPTPTARDNSPAANSPSGVDFKLTSNGWDVSYFGGATDQMRNWTFLEILPGWSEFPNVDFPKYGFLSRDGVEYGMAESAYCEQDQACDINVPAMHYRLVTGDYRINGIDECSLGDRGGCGIALINVGVVTSMYRDSMVDYGFTVEGRYWNGDAMPVTIQALMSNTAFNMMNAKAFARVNPGANCSSPWGCERVRLCFAVISGNELLVKGTTVVTK